MSNYEWKLKDGAPIGLIGAFGVSFEMIPFDRLSDLNASLESDIEDSHLRLSAEVGLLNLS